MGLKSVTEPEPGAEKHHSEEQSSARVNLSKRIACFWPKAITEEHSAGGRAHLVHNPDYCSPGIRLKVQFHRARSAVALCGQAFFRFASYFSQAVQCSH